MIYDNSKIVRSGFELVSNWFVPRRLKGGFARLDGFVGLDGLGGLGDSGKFAELMVRVLICKCHLEEKEMKKNLTSTAGKEWPNGHKYLV